MGRTMLVVCLLGLLLATAGAISLPGLPGEVMSVTHEECHWVCATFGVFMECAFNEAVTGACGAKTWANCENDVYCPDQKKIYAAIQCCKLNIAVNVE